MGTAFQKAIPVLRIFDVEKAKEFYVGVLGFSFDREHHFAEKHAGVHAGVERWLTLHLSEHHGDGCPRLDRLRLDDGHRRDGLKVAPRSARDSSLHFWLGIWRFGRLNHQENPSRSEGPP